MSKRALNPLDKAPVPPAPRRCDVLIIGAGAAGLSLALSLAGTGLDVRLVDRQTTDGLARPAYDGREIALSLRSIGILEALNVWPRIAPEDRSPLRSAKVFDGRWHAPLHFDPGPAGADKLGFFVANSTLRRALYQAYEQHGGRPVIGGVAVVDLAVGARGGRATLSTGVGIDADLIVSADTRFSATRRMAGVAAESHAFNQTMIVSKVRFQDPHGQIALQGFLPGGAMAVLPLNGGAASLVQTFAPAEAERQMALETTAYLEAANMRLDQRFGAITSVSERFTYPIVATYAHKFVRPGFALVGDAAVGMHPMAAHGFNLGVQGQSILASHIRRSIKAGRGPSDPRALRAYERDHRQLSRGLYYSTLAIAELYAKENAPAKFARRVLLDAGRIMSPARRRILRGVTEPLQTM